MNQKKTKTFLNMETTPLRDVPERLEEFMENLLDERFPAHRDAPASSSRESASEPRVKVVPTRASTVFILTSRRTKIARFASESRFQGLLAENARAQLYLEQKIW